MRVNENILISSLTTMRLGGPARYVLEVERPEEIPDAYGFADTYHLPTFVLGYGANTIGHDGQPEHSFRLYSDPNQSAGMDEVYHPQGSTIAVMRP